MTQQIVLGHYKYLKWLKQMTVAATNCNRLQWNTIGYSRLRLVTEDYNGL